MRLYYAMFTIVYIFRLFQPQYSKKIVSHFFLERVELGVTTTGRLCACRLMLFSLLLPHQLAELSPDASPREESPAAVAMTVQQLHLSDEDLACDVKACGPVIIPVFSDRDPLECRAVCVVLVYSSSTLFSFLPRAAYVCRHLECKR